MSNKDKIILVLGATGQQGGATARELASRGFSVRAFTRDPDKPAARALVERGLEVVKGELAGFNRTLGGKKLDIVS